MNFEDSSNEINDKIGVVSETIEDGHYVVSVVWKDGKKNTHHFPVGGFPVVDVVTRKVLGHISGEDAVDILREEAPRHNSDDFSWTMFV